MEAINPKKMQRLRDYLDAEGASLLLSDLVPETRIAKNRLREAIQTISEEDEDPDLLTSFDKANGTVTPVEGEGTPAEPPKVEKAKPAKKKATPELDLSGLSFTMKGEDGLLTTLRLVAHKKNRVVLAPEPQEQIVILKLAGQDVSVNVTELAASGDPTVTFPGIPVAFATAEVLLAAKLAS